jgi:hypothetical protein
MVYVFKMTMAIAYLCKNAVEQFKFKIIEIDKKYRWTQRYNTETPIIIFCLFKMAVAIVFLCKNTVEAI